MSEKPAMVKPTTLPLSQNIKADGSVTSLAEYQSNYGYQGLAKALSMSPTEVVDWVKDANLRGRGGAGFSAGLKWSFVPPLAKLPGQRFATPMKWNLVRLKTVG